MANGLKFINVYCAGSRLPLMLHKEVADQLALKEGQRLSDAEYEQALQATATYGLAYAKMKLKQKPPWELQ